MASSRCSCEAALLGYGQEITQMSQLDLALHSANVSENAWADCCFFRSIVSSRAIIQNHVSSSNRNGIPMQLAPLNANNAGNAYDPRLPL